VSCKNIDPPIFRKRSCASLTAALVHRIGEHIWMFFGKFFSWIYLCAWDAARGKISQRGSALSPLPQLQHEF
jgi:hypothetical protein